MKTWHWTLVVLLVVVALIAAPLVLLRGSEFAGADGKAQAAISEIDPGYVPWFKPMWQPAPETSSMLFALQAAIGAGAVAFAFGYWVGRHNSSAQEGSGQGEREPGVAGVSGV